MNRLLLYPIAALLLSVFAFSCKSKKTFVQGEPLSEKSAAYLLKRYERNEIKANWIGLKIDAEVIVKGESQGFKANIRMRRDSAIWISISPALGIEVLRLLITPDSLKCISKIPDQKFFYAGSFELINEMAKTDLDFRSLQDMLVGNAVGLDREEGKFRSEIDHDRYLLISKYKRKIRRVVGVDDRKLNPNDTISVDVNDRRYKRIVRKSDDDLIISRYWLEPNHFKATKSVFDDLRHQRTISLDYDEFEQIESTQQYYPRKIAMKVRESKAEQILQFEIRKFIIDKPYELPFEVPDDLPLKKHL